MKTIMILTQYASSTDMTNRLYISDLDRTFLRNDATISNYSKRKLNELLSQVIELH